ncbi:P-loop containing nucleoside triphosphate hydrolase protein [Lentinula aciculospora]|uniref:P-loop containing nucleoside triphosphate hydrolase protein n=1 Tax=Lentinula aciculospora TaxID=153920 RepID=A0A9W9A1E8_9AGAR|nr:P-loop containing nucleoside triphosphate hydrolase protein [Lentinula aciculospora]
MPFVVSTESRKEECEEDSTSAYDIWLASRATSGSKELLIPGAKRPITIRNAQLVYLMIQNNAFGLLKSLYNSHPNRTILMLAAQLARSLFPAFRGYSQALIIDEIQLQFASEAFTWPRLLRLSGSELVRRYLESLLDSYAAHNEGIVMDSAKFSVEYQQLQQRVQLDCSTFADPLTRDLLHESDLFARSFNGSGFGSLSPMDFLQIFSLLVEITSHLFLILSVTRSYTHIYVLLLSLCSTFIPLVLPQSILTHNSIDSQFTAREAHAADRRERMRNMAFSDIYRPEVQLFGLQKWILSNWATSWWTVHESEVAHQSQLSLTTGIITLSDLFRIIQNVPFLLLLQGSSATLGSLSLYRSSIHSVIYNFRNLVTTIGMAFQSVFLMAAWCASTELKPKLQPEHQDKVRYKSVSGGIGIQARELSYTYPGSSEPALKNVNFTLGAGETLAIVGYNGSGKSTLAKILLRIVDFDKGELIVNGHDLRRYDPSEYHQHLSAVLQGFSKFNSTLRENVGVGSVDNMASKDILETAVSLAQADGIVQTLPHGLQTILQSPAFEPVSYAESVSTTSSVGRYGLSGGEWQRIAIARAFMRAYDPRVDMLVFDEPTSSLDAKAQKEIFDTIRRLSRSPDGTRRRTVVFITHQLSIARRADQIAMMENGTISDFGPHDQLLARNGPYAALYKQTI